MAWDTQRDWPAVLENLALLEAAALGSVLGLWGVSYLLKRRLGAGHALLPPWVSQQV